MKNIYVLTVVLSMLLCATVLFSGCGSNATGGGGGGSTIVGGNGTVEVNGILYITEAGTGRIFIYDHTTGESGLHIPDRVVSGGATQLDDGMGYYAFLDIAKDKLYVPDGNAILVFANASTMDGNVAPERVIIGGNTGLNIPCGIFVMNHKIYVANCSGDDIRVFTEEANGNVAPLHVITCEAMIEPTTLYVTTLETAYISYDLSKASPWTASDQMNVINNISTRDGLVTPDRTIKFSYNLPKGVIVDETNNRLFVALRDHYINEYDNASTLSGTPTPTHHSAPVTQTNAIAYDPTNDHLYVIQDYGATVEVWNNASTIEGTYDSHITISGEGVVGGMGIAFDPTR